MHKAQSRATIYIDREGDQISEKEWKQLRMDPGYTVIREYDNGFYSVRVGWLGEIRDPHSVLPEHYKAYVFAVCKIHPAILEPIETIKCGSENEAIDLYEDFLVRNCGCKWVPSAAEPNTHHFVDYGNRLKPLSKDMPVAASRVDDELIGSW